MDTKNELPKTAMAVVAHPDDVEFGCGGTLAKWAREGWEITLVICTDASGGGADDAEDVSPVARHAINITRKAEQKNAAQVIGIKNLIFLDQPDGLLMHTIELRKMLVRLMRRYRPTRLLCQSPDRTWKPFYPVGRHHPDHLAAGAATIAAMYPASQNGWDFPELLQEGLTPHKVRELYVIGAPELNHFEDITSTLDVKVEALRAHVSQLGARFADVEKRVRDFAASNGKEYGVAAAEVFNRTEN